MTKRFAILLCLLVPCGCGKVLGYYPTEAELDAIERGEDPRANETSKPAKKPVEKDRPRDQGGGLDNGNPERNTNSGGAGERNEEPGANAAGPGTGVVLRWVDCGLVIVEAEGKRERVRLIGVEVPRDYAQAQDELNQRREDFPSGTKLALTYPQNSADGKVIIYRNTEGDLLANIRKQ